MSIVTDDVTKWAAILLLVLAAAACSSSGSPTAAPTTTQPAMTTQQVASIVAQHRAELLDAITKEGRCDDSILAAISDEAFKGVGSAELPDIDALATCEGAANTLSTEGHALKAGLRGIAPPAELTELVAQTKAGALAVADEAASLAHCLPEIATMVGPDLNARYAADGKIQTCGDDMYSLDPDVKSLQATLNGWDAYL